MKKTVHIFVAACLWVLCSMKGRAELDFLTDKGESPSKQDVPSIMGKLLSAPSRDTLEAAPGINLSQAQVGRIQAHLDQTQSLVDQGKWREASDEMDKALAIAPQHPDLLLKAGVIRMKVKQYEKARYCWDNLAAKFPRNKDYAILYGISLYRLRQFEKSSDVLKKALRLAPQNLLARLHLASDLIALNRNTEALGYIRNLSALQIGLMAQLIAEDEELSDVLPSKGYRFLCASLLSAGEKTDMSDDRTTLTARMASVFKDLSQGYDSLRLNRWADARNALEMAAKAGVSSPGLQGDIAYCRFMEGQKDEALKQIEPLATAYPDRMDLQILYGILLYESGRHEEAGDKLAAVYKLHADNPDIVAPYGTYLLQEERYAEALPVLEAAYQMLPGSAAITFYCACAYSQQGVQNKFMILFQTLKDRFPNELNLWLGQDEPYVRELKKNPAVIEWMGTKKQIN